MASVRWVSGAVCSRSVAETNAEVDFVVDLLSGISCAENSREICLEYVLMLKSPHIEEYVRRDKRRRRVDEAHWRVTDFHMKSITW